MRSEGFRGNCQLDRGTEKVAGHCHWLLIELCVTLPERDLARGLVETVEGDRGLHRELFAAKNIVRRFDGSHGGVARRQRPADAHRGERHPAGGEPPHRFLRRLGVGVAAVAEEHDTRQRAPWHGLSGRVDGPCHVGGHISGG